jgi:DUF2946 family protein
MVESITAIPRRYGAWLALLALVLQLGLSIGHVHKIGADWGHAAVLSWVKPISGSSDGRSPAGVPVVPAEEGQCPVCSSLAVAGTFILAAALCVVLAFAARRARLDPATQPVRLSRRPFSPARQRAPPPVATPA